MEAGSEERNRLEPPGPRAPPATDALAAQWSCPNRADARAVLAGTDPPVLEVRKDVAVASGAGMGDFGDPQRHLPLPALDRWLDE